MGDPSDLNHQGGPIKDFKAEGMRPPTAEQMARDEAAREKQTVAIGSTGVHSGQLRSSMALGSSAAARLPSRRSSRRTRATMP